MKNKQKLVCLLGSVLVVFSLSLSAKQVLADNSATSEQQAQTNSENQSDSTSGQETAQPGKDEQQPNKADKKKPKKDKNISKFAPVVKIAGRRNYNIYAKIVKGKARRKVTRTNIGYRKNHLESTEYIKTKQGRYWLLYVDGRKIGYVHEHYFARHAISIAKTVNLVRNPYYKFPVKYAVNYVTNKYGSVVTPKMSKKYISTKKPGTYKVKIGYDGHYKTLKVVVRKDLNEGIKNAMAKPEGQGITTLSAPCHHTGNSGHYNNWTDYEPEKVGHDLSDNGLNLKSIYYQPVYLSLHARQKNNKKWDNAATTVGHILEGTTVYQKHLYTSYLAHVNNMQGHVVGYDLAKLSNHFNAQYLLSKSLSSFNAYIKHMIVSPYIITGHGQAMGSTKKYVYLMANDHTLHGEPDSELIVQLNKKNLTINKIWGFKVWNQSAADPRYAQNGYMISDNTLLILVNNGANDRYEWWQLNKKGNSWEPELAAVTKGRFVNNGAPVQGIAYDKQNNKYYIAFNDLICRCDGAGNYETSFKFNTGREIEGISVANGCLYVNLSQRPELLVSQKL